MLFPLFTPSPVSTPPSGPFLATAFYSMQAWLWNGADGRSTIQGYMTIPPSSNRHFNNLDVSWGILNNSPCQTKKSTKTDSNNPPQLAKATNNLDRDNEGSTTDTMNWPVTSP